MIFALKLFGYILWAKRRWALFILIPPVIYCLIAALVPDRFSIEQHISATQTAEVRLGKKPGSTLPMQDILAQPDIFFQDDFALLLFKRSVFPDSADSASSLSLPVSLKNMVGKNMSLSKSGNQAVVVSYDGPDRHMGRKLVSFYAQRLADKLIPDTKHTGPKAHSDQSQLMGQLETEGRRAWWRMDRLVPLIGIILASMLAFIGLIALFAFMDSSLKSERQVARYVDLPILGVVPNLDSLSAALKEGPSNDRTYQM